MDLTPCPFSLGSSAAKPDDIIPAEISHNGIISCKINGLTYKNSSSNLKDCNYATVIYNKKSKQSSLFFNAPEFLVPVIDVEVIDEGSDRASVQRQELTKQFGSVWSKKMLRDRELIEARTAAASDASVLERVAVGVAKVRSEATEENEKKDSVGVVQTQQEQLLPPFSQETKVVSQIFPISKILLPAITNALSLEANAISTADENALKDLIKHYNYPRFISDRFQFLPMDNLEAVGLSLSGPKRKRKAPCAEGNEVLTRMQMATILAYMGHLFALLRLKGGELQQKSPLPNAPVQVSRYLLDQFTTFVVRQGKGRRKLRQGNSSSSARQANLSSSCAYYALRQLFHCSR
ncbi:hypothetical protein Aperf_G00000131070 [Anoplocephala perfoliata]